MHYNARETSQLKAIAFNSIKVIAAEINNQISARTVRHQLCDLNLPGQIYSLQSSIVMKGDETKIIFLLLKDPCGGHTCSSVSIYFNNFQIKTHSDLHAEIKSEMCYISKRNS